MPPSSTDSDARERREGPGVACAEAIAPWAPRPVELTTDERGADLVGLTTDERGAALVPAPPARRRHPSGGPPVALRIDSGRAVAIDLVFPYDGVREAPHRGATPAPERGP